LALNFLPVALRAGGAVWQNAQGLPVCCANVADACAFSGHKLGAPYCTGALYVKRELLGRLRPWRVGGGTVEDVTLSGGRYKVKYLGNYQGFEAGVQNCSGAAGLAAALDRLEKCGFANIRAHVSGLVDGALKGLAGIKGVRVLGAREDLLEGSLISMMPEKALNSIQRAKTSRSLKM